MNEKQQLLGIIGVVVVGVLVMLIFYRDSNHPVLNNPTQSDGATTTVLWESKSDERGAVAINVTPIALSSSVPEWKFDVALNTHSVELDWDMTRVASLVDDAGKVYAPQKWEGALGGHHREGVLIFKPIIPMPKSVELKIAGGVEPVKSFAWSLTN